MQKNKFFPIEYVQACVAFLQTFYYDSTNDLSKSFPYDSFKDFEGTGFTNENLVEMAHKLKNMLLARAAGPIPIKHGEDLYWKPAKLCYWNFC